VGYGASASLGIGFDLDFTVGLKDNSKFIVRWKAGVVLGGGFSGSLSCIIDAGAIWTFIQFVYHKLKDSNFSFLEFITEEAFNQLMKIQLYIIEKGVDVVKDIGDYFEKKLEDIDNWIGEVVQYWEKRSREREDAENLARRIIANPEIIKFTSPEAKGAMLYTLTYTFLLSNEKSQEKAILHILNWVQTFEEYYKICNRITRDGTKNLMMPDEPIIEIPQNETYTETWYEFKMIMKKKNSKSFLLFIFTDKNQITADCITDNDEYQTYIHPVTVELSANEEEIRNAKNQNLLFSSGHHRIKSIFDNMELKLFNDFIYNLKSRSELYKEGKLNNSAVKQNKFIDSIPDDVWDNLI